MHGPLVSSLARRQASMQKDQTVLMASSVFRAELVPSTSSGFSFQSEVVRGELQIQIVNMRVLRAEVQSGGVGMGSQREGSEWRIRVRASEWGDSEAGFRVR